MLLLVFIKDVPMEFCPAHLTFDIEMYADNNLHVMYIKVSNKELQAKINEFSKTRLMSYQVNILA